MAGTRFSWLVAAYALSNAGNYLNLVALGLFTYQVTGGGLGVGLLMALRLGAGSLGGLAAGSLAARFDRRRVMICADLAQALAMTALAAGSGTRDLVLLPVVVVVLGAGNAVFSVALRTSVPEMVGQEARVRANGRVVAAKSFGTVAGFASAGVVIGGGGVELAFAVNAVSFAVSAFALLFVRPRATSSEPVAGPLGAKTRTTGARTALRGLLPGALLPMVALRGVDALASASHNVALPVLASTAHAADSASFLSRFWGAWAVGVLLAHQVTTRRLRHGDTATGERVFALATCVMAVSFALAFRDLAPPLLLCAALVAGVADGVAEIAYTSRLQEVPEHRRGRLFGLSTTVETSGFAIGMVASGAALEVLPAVVVVSLCHGFALCAAAVLLLMRYLGAGKDDADVEAGALHGAGAGAH